MKKRTELEKTLLYSRPCDRETFAETKLSAGEAGQAIERFYDNWPRMRVWIEQVQNAFEEGRKK